MILGSFLLWKATFRAGELLTLLIITLILKFDPEKMIMQQFKSIISRLNGSYRKFLESTFKWARMYKELYIFTRTKLNFVNVPVFCHI
jgi:hypothetical protein